jgi:transposase
MKKRIAFKPISVVIEASGIYYRHLVLELSSTGFPVSKINLKSSRNFAGLMFQHCERDATDAQLLVECGEGMTPRLWSHPNPVSGSAPFCCSGCLSLSTAAVAPDE